MPTVMYKMFLKLVVVDQCKKSSYCTWMFMTYYTNICLDHVKNCVYSLEFLAFNFKGINIL
jgi:hypothetical protein